MKSRFLDVRFAVCLMALVAVFVVTFVLASPKQNAQESAKRSDTYQRFATADAVTADIRDASKVFERVIVKNTADRVAVAKYGRIVADYGAFVVIVKNGNVDLSRSKLEHQPIETSISLPSIKLDPLGDPPAGTVRPGTAAAGTGGYYIVQFGAIAMDEWLDSLRDAGVELLQYVPHNAFYVYGDAAAIAKAASHSRVRWVGAFLPEHKISPVLADQLAAADGNRSPKNGVSPIELTRANAAMFDVAVFKRADAAAIASRIAMAYGGSAARIIDLPNNYFNVIRVELPLERVTGIAEIPDVITIDAYGKPRIEDERAAHIVAGNYTSMTAVAGPGYNPLTQFGVDGEGVTVSVYDDGISIPGNGGFYVTSTNTVHGPLRGSTAGASGGHGHINASIISGNTPFGILDPTGHNYGVGVAPRSHIINIPGLKAGYSGVEADVYSDTVITAGPNGVFGSISNNSWGNGTNSNVYDSYTAQFDGFVRDATAGGGIDPIALVYSAGNSGPGALTLTRPKAAKNVIAVGNSENVRTELSANANNMDDLTSSSSRGPAADGRVKPDIVAPGTVITGSRAGNCGTVSSCFDANHAWSSGTSHAAPQVAGAAALFTQHWKNANGGMNPSPALIKAAIINTAQEMNGVNTTAVSPNGNEGWGRINMKFMLDAATSIRRVNETVPFGAPGASSTMTGTVADASKQIRVALVWTDPPGAANANPALVNNLDLSVTIGANTYRGNVFSGGVSTTGGAADTLNNVEIVRLPSGVAAGTPFSITVSATAINGDGILGNADATDQHFALVAYNYTEQVPRSRADFDGDGRTDLSVFRGTEGNWYLNRSTAGLTVQNWGLNGDIPIPGDFDGDNKTDIAVYRGDVNAANPDFYILRSSNNTFAYYSWGVPGDVPVSGDFDGDLKTDIAVFRPANSTWYVLTSLGGVAVANFGSTGDVPMVMDYEGDGLSNLAVFRPSDRTWYISKPTGVPAQNFYAVQFGLATDMPVPADYDGNGSDDIAVFRPSTGIWYIVRAGGAVDAIGFGINGDVPVPGDYDGDGRDDVAVYRGGTWYLNRSTAGIIQFNFGIGSDKPIPKAYIP